jgi:PAS domain S-box-containing protein
MWVSLLCGIVYGLSLAGEERVVFGLRCIPAFSFLGFCYMLGRSRWYLVGVMVLSGGLVVAGATVVAISNDADVVGTMLMLGILGIAFAGALLPAWAVGLTGLGAVLNIAIYAVVYPSSDKLSLFAIAAGLVTVTAMLCIRAQIYQMETIDRRYSVMRQVHWVRTLSLAFEAVRTPLARISSDGFVEEANQALIQMFGSSLVDVLDAPLEAIAAPDDPMEHPLDLSPLDDAEGPQRINTRRKYKHSDGHLLTAKLSIGVGSMSGDRKVYVATMEDITPYIEALERREERRQVMNKLVQNRREIISLVNHQVRTPLNGIMGTVDILSRQNPECDDQAEFLDIIKGSADALLEMVDDSLSETHKQPSYLVEMDGVEVDLGAMLEAVCRLCAEKAVAKGVELICEVGANVPRLVWADAAGLRQVILSLLDESIDMAQRGVVYCGITVVNWGTLRATVEFVFRESMARDTEFDLNFSVSNEDGEEVALDPGLRPELHRAVGAIGGSILSNHVKSGRKTTRLRFDWAISSDRVPSRTGRPLDGRCVWVAVEPSETQMAIVRMSRVLGAEAHPVSPGELLEGTESGTLASEGVDTVILDVGRSTPEGVLIRERLNEVLGVNTDLHFIHLGDVLQVGELAKCTAIYGGVALTKPVAFSGLPGAFVVPMPVVEVREPSEVTDITETDADHPGGRVLLVEDDPIHRKIMTQMLERMGMYVEAVTSGRHALELFFGRGYDLVFMDCVLPNMNGLETTQKLRQAESAGNHTIIIGMSASAMEAEKQRCLAAGMDDFLPKPIRFEDLERTAQRWFDFR